MIENLGMYTHFENLAFLFFGRW